MRFEERPQNDPPEYVDGLPVGDILRALKGLRYGYVQIIVQDSKVVQIDRTEKTRLTGRFQLHEDKRERG